MTILKLDIRSIGEEPVWKDINEKNFIELLTWERAAISEKGMTGGGTAVAFALSDGHGGYYLVNTNAGAIKFLHEAIIGAEMAWKVLDDKKKK